MRVTAAHSGVVGRAQTRRVVRVVARLITYLVLLALSLMMLFPLLWLVRSSFMNSLEIFDTPMRWLPHEWLWPNFQQALTIVPFATYYRNTALLEVLNVTGNVLSSSFVAFGFARIEFRGRTLLFSLILTTLMVPSVVTMIPTFVIWHAVGGLNTYYPLFVPAFFGNAFFIFMLRQFFRGIPRDYDEAAMIDGAGYLRIYWSIILPLSKPALTTVAVFTFLNVWNDFLGPLIYLSDASMYTVALGLQAFQGLYYTQWNLLMAASTVATIPLVVVFFLAQKSFIQGATLTGLKG